MEDVDIFLLCLGFASLVFGMVSLIFGDRIIRFLRQKKRVKKEG